MQAEEASYKFNLRLLEDYNKYAAGVEDLVEASLYNYLQSSDDTIRYHDFSVTKGNCMKNVLHIYTSMYLCICMYVFMYVSKHRCNAILGHIRLLTDSFSFLGSIYTEFWATGEMQPLLQLINQTVTPIADGSLALTLPSGQVNFDPYMLLDSQPYMGLDGVSMITNSKT